MHDEHAKTLEQGKKPPAPERIGPYRLRQRIGQGGMGEVWAAEQVEPIRRPVALKLIKRGMDTERVVARFGSERQALALMDHPNIAKVLDAGATDDGRPYFVMELVRGVPLLDYCTEHKLDLHARLALFLDICAGVQHAHQKGIIHRDLKPSNILVGERDGKAEPKIIDFGIAKATSQSLTENTLYTQVGHLIGTPSYMSPEQASTTLEDIDTRSDVYTLGVVLYEMLVGSRPFEVERGQGASIELIRRQIREELPPRPSTRVTQLGDTFEAAAYGATEPRELSKILRGDLDWIVLKALEKDRSRRYSSVSDLMADLNRYLNHQPVLASPPSPWYRTRKFVERHRMGVSAAALVVLAMIAGIVGTSVGLVRALAAERAAQEEAQTSRQIAGFLTEIFEVSAPEAAQGEELTAREILDRGARRIEHQLEDRPAVRARMLSTIGNVYRKLGLYREAEPLLEESLASWPNERNAEAAVVRTRLAALRESQGRYDESAALAREALDLLSEDDPETPSALSTLGLALAGKGEYVEAEQLFRRVAELREGDGESPELATALNDLGIFLWQRGRYEEAEKLLRRALALFEETLGAEDFQVRSALDNLAVLTMSQGKYEESEALYLRALELKERVLGEDSKSTANTLNNLGILYDLEGRFDEAERLFRRTLRIYESTLPGEHEDVGRAVGNLAWIQYRQGRFDEAEEFYRRATSIQERALGPRNVELATLLKDQAMLYAAQDKVSDAIVLLRRALAIRAEKLGNRHPDTADSQHALAMVLTRRGEHREAADLLRQALETQREVLPADHPTTARTASDLEAVTKALSADPG